MKSLTQKILILCLLLIVAVLSHAQVNWSKDGNSYFRIEKNEITRYTLPENVKNVLVSADMLIPPNGQPLKVRAFYLSNDQSKVLIYTNTKKVWRLDTQGDYWVLDLNTKSLQQVGATLPASSLRFAKFSPDATKVAYVSEFNLFVEDLATRLQLFYCLKQSTKSLMFYLFRSPSLSKKNATNVYVYDGLGFRSASLSPLPNEIKKTKLQIYTSPKLA